MKHIWWAWAVKNSVCMICWTVLAIAFDRWWIALVGVLTLSSLTKKEEEEEDDS